MYEIKTNLTSDELTKVAVEIYERWAAFAMGESVLGGRKLQHPGARWGSARYASSITMSPLHREGNRVYYEIYADEDVAPEAAFIEHGRAGFDLGEQLLAGPKAHETKEGDGRYVHVLITHPENPPTYGLGLPTPQVFGDAAYFKATGITTQGARAHSNHVDTTHTIRTVSSLGGVSGLERMNPFQPSANMDEGVFGGAKWYVPAMHAFAPAKTLYALYDEEYGTQ